MKLPANPALPLIAGENARSHGAIQTAMGNKPAMTTSESRRAPDRRRVSARWMLGTVLTGVTSLLLMGGALHAALDGRQQLAQPANTLNKLVGQFGQNQLVVKGDRPAAVVALQPVKEKIVQVPTITKVGNSDVIRKKPFAYAFAPLAVAELTPVKYPAFNPLTVFRASGSDTRVASSDVIYGADIESEVRIKHVPFPLDTSESILPTRIPPLEAEAVLHRQQNFLDNGETRLAPIPSIYAGQSTKLVNTIKPASELDIKITAENVSTVVQDKNDSVEGYSYYENVITTAEKQTIAQALSGLGMEPASLKEMVRSLEKQLGKGPLTPGTKLRISWEQRINPLSPTGKQKICRRISVYKKGKHINSIALNDEGVVVWGSEPDPIPAIADKSGDLERDAIAKVSASKLPNVYDGIFRAALSQNLGVHQARQIVRTVAFDVDFRNKINLTDDLEVFYSLEEGQKIATDQSEILYIGLTLNGKKRKYYRFATGKKGKIDYYNDKGKSSKKFLLRKPVPNAKFTSGFGRRRHPISRVVKMHQGVDFSAPRGTPILAAGAGVVEKAGWNAGYGRQTIIRHANGYKTSYSHQHRIAKGIRPGARVVQGQIIGKVGSTGYSTGPHLHYEVIVNGSKVNPMKIRLPKGKELKGKELKAFETERKRIDSLVKKARGTESLVAAVN